jgi:hypothetical protein
MNRADLPLSCLFSILKGESKHTLRCRTSDELDTLHNPVDYDMLNPGILSLGVFTNKYSIDIVVWGLVPSNGLARANVRKKIERAAESKVEGNMAFTNGSLYISGSAPASNMTRDINEPPGALSRLHSSS